MISRLLPATILSVALLAPVPVLAGVHVRFIDPERYSDADFLGVRTRDATLAEFRLHFEKLGERYLAPGQNLTIDVLNIDLAGAYEPWRRNFSEVRILRDVTPPRFKLRYVMSGKGKRPQTGEAIVTDINYQMNISARFSSERYPYEKAILTDWFRRTFAKAQAY